MSSQRQRRKIDDLRKTLLENWEGDTVQECLQQAEQAASTTPIKKRKRCPNPNCRSVRIRRKPGYDIEHKRDGDWVCTDCREHFSSYAPPDAVVDAELNLTLRLSDETKFCCACGDRARVFVYDADYGVGGTVCFDHIGDLIAKGDADD
jgi:hypothetical protein